MSVAAEILQSELAELERPNLADKLTVRGLAIVTSGREPNDFNEFGLVVPPPIDECMGDGCAFRGTAEACQLTRHHLHSTAPDYEAEGELAEEFRDLGIMTAWLRECIHREHHNRYDIHVPVPHEKIMKRSRYENKKVKALITNFRTTKSNEEALNSSGLTENGKKSLNKVKERLLKERDELLEKINRLEVIPEELITGALLLAAPEIAQRRIKSGSGVALPGLIQKAAEVPFALNNLQEILEAA